ncbi:oligosaccharide flippase family protein [Microbacterium aurum]
MANLLTRLVGFSSLPFLSALLPFVALPIVARVGGVDGWSAFNVGQAVGAYAAAVGYVGWNVMGTPMVAVTRDRTERVALYARSFYARVGVVAVVAVGASIVAVVLAPESTRAVAVMFAVTGAVGGLGLAWFAVGVSSVGIIVWFEIVPRAAATALAIPLLLWTGDVFWYGLLMLLASVLGVVLFHLLYCRAVLPVWVGWRTVAQDLRLLRAAWGVEVVGNLYANAPVPVATATSSLTASATFGSGDRLYRYGLLGVVAVGNAVQGWVLEVDDTRRRTRNRAAILILVAVGVTGLLFLLFAGEAVTALLFGAELAAERSTLLWLGVAFLAVAASTPLIRNVLMPAGRQRPVFIVTVVSALVGIVGMIVLGKLMGPAGVAAGLAISEVMTLVACAWLSWRIGLSGRVGFSAGHDAEDV